MKEFSRAHIDAFVTTEDGKTGGSRAFAAIRRKRNDIIRGSYQGICEVSLPSHGWLWKISMNFSIYRKSLVEVICLY